MKKPNNLHILIMVIASISILVGAYQILQGDSFSDHFASILLGVSLFGVGAINYKNEKDENK